MQRISYRIFYWVPLFVAYVILSTQSSVVADANGDAHPPIPITFELKEAGFVTLVIDDAQGRRVRNLIAETSFDAGKHTLWWDGMDDDAISHDPAVKHCYSIRPKLVEPGQYHIHGLFRKDVDLRYEFSAYNAGNPPWETEDRTGGWLADHTPEADVLFLPKGSPYSPRPQMLLSSTIAEGGYSLAWLDLDGNKVYSGKAAGWRGGYALARDDGNSSRQDLYAYTAFLYKGVNVYGLGAEELSVPIFSCTEGVFAEAGAKAAGKSSHPIGANVSIAVHDGTVALSMPEANQIFLISLPKTLPIRGNKPIGTLAGKLDVPAPGGLWADADGTLYVLSEGKLKRLRIDWEKPAIHSQSILVDANLEEPRRVTRDAVGNFFISDWGRCHQVKVFSPQGQFLRAVGKPLGPQTGHYDPEGMANPLGLAISGDNCVWVAEHTYLPKRLSVWAPDGKLVRAFYGPARYGGGGTIDPVDPTRFFYAFPGIMEFHLDWTKGTSDLVAIGAQGKGDEEENSAPVTGKEGKALQPERPIHLGDRLYLTNAYESGEAIVGIWMMKDSVARMVAAAGTLTQGPVFRAFIGQNSEAVQKQLPAGWTIERSKKGDEEGAYDFQQEDKKPGVQSHLMVVWSDRNGDGRMQPEELSFVPYENHYPRPCVTVDDTLALTNAAGLRLEAIGFSPAGAPLYDANRAARLITDPIALGALPERQALLARDGYLVVTGGPMEGYKDGRRMWYYHSQWGSGFSKGHSPRPQYPGQLLNTMKLLGPLVQPPGTDMQIWGVNGDYGQLYLLTSDGLFVASLFKDSRMAESRYWPSPAQRGMPLNDVSLGEECYCPTMTQTADGKIYVQAGKHRCTIIRVDGLGSLRRLDAGSVTMTPELLAQVQQYQEHKDDVRTTSRPAADAPLRVTLRDKPPAVDGNLDDWKDAQWVDIDNRTRAAVCICGNTLYAAFHMEYEYRLESSPDSLDTLFKGGPALDLMIGCDPNADPQRKTPVPSDLRLLVTMVHRKTQAAVFRAVVPGTKDPVKYASPVGSASIDQVEDISAKVSVAGGKHADDTGKKKHDVPILHKYSDYELAVPLSALGLSPAEGMSIRGDIGLLQGQPGITSDRVYWHNKSGSLTSDAPTEARLTPGLWGQWIFAVPTPASAPAETPKKKRNKNGERG